MDLLTDPADATSLEDDSAKKRRVLVDRARQLQGQIQSTPVAPVISTKGPDPHVLAGRQERAINKARRVAGVPGATAQMSEADIKKLERSSSGKSLVPETPGIDAYRAQNSPEAIAARQSQSADRAAEAAKQQSQYQAGMRARVSAAAAAQRARRTSVPPPAPSAPDAYSRMRDLAPSLRPGDSVKIQDGNQIAGARKNSDGVFEVAGYQSDPGAKLSVRPGTVINPGGKRVPIADEISRMEKVSRAAGEQANQNAIETASVIQKNQDQALAIPDPYRAAPTPMPIRAPRGKIRGVRSTI